jgi:acid phosphatase type 7
MSRGYVRAILPVLLVTLAAAPAAGAAVRVWVVGDGGVSGPEDDAVAARIETEGIDRLLYLGDVYENGTAVEFANRYHPSFGRFKRITAPTIGNHEWASRATGYDAYWGPLARRRSDGGYWYSFDVGGWHVVSLSSMQRTGPTSAQASWLRRDLRKRPGTCTIAFTHHPRHSASFHGDTPRLDPLWRALSGRAVAVLAGNDHSYQRHRPNRGLVQFVVGTGGRRLYDVDESDSRLAASHDRSHGALLLRLGRRRVTFAFVTAEGARLDSGALPCRPHAARVRILRPGDGVRYRRGLRTLRVRVRAAVRPAVVSLARRASTGCRVLWRGRFRSLPCLTRLGFRIPDLPAGRVRPLGRRSLPAGRYVLTVRARGFDGRIVSRFVRFRVG